MWWPTLIMLMGFPPSPSTWATNTPIVAKHNTADAAPLAAAVELSQPGGSAQDALDPAISFVDQNTSIPISAADWVSDAATLNHWHNGRRV